MWDPLPKDGSVKVSILQPAVEQGTYIELVYETDRPSNSWLRPGR